MDEKRYAILKDVSFGWALAGSVLEIISEEKKEWNGQTYFNYEIRGSSGSAYYVTSDQVQEVKVTPIE